MATTQTAIKFYKGAYGIETAKTTATGGAVVFDTTSRCIFVNGQIYGGGTITDATFTDNILTIRKDGDTAQSPAIKLDFSTLANAQSVMQAFDDVADELNAIETGAGLNENGTYTAPLGTNYLGNATSLKNADTLLDAAIKAVDNKVVGAIQTIEINENPLSESSDHTVEIAVDGTYNASTNKIATESTVSGAIDGLDVTGYAQGSIAASSGENPTTSEIKIKGIKEENGKIANDSSNDATINVDGVYNASTNMIATESTVTNAINALDGSATIASASNGVVTLKAGITEADGVVSNNSGLDITLAKVATTGAAADVSYAGSDVAGSEPATVEGALDDLYVKVNQAIDAAGVTEFGGKTGAITLGSYLTMGENANDHQVSVTNVDTAGTSTTNTDLATVKTVTTHINALDTQSDVQAVGYTAADSSNGAKLTFKGVSETDGVIAQGTGTTELQFAKVATSGAAADVSITDSGNVITATTVEDALQEIATEIDGMDGSHDVATGATYTPGADEYATYKLDLFDATETDGKITTNNSAADTLYFTKAYSASNPILTKDDIGSLSGAMHFKGTVDGTTTTLPTTNITAGDVYIVSTAGTYAGQACEVGDMVIAKSTKASSVTDSDWTVVTGENQVTPVQGGAELVAGASPITIGTVDGVALTAKTTVTAGTATIASKSGDVVTIKTGVAQGTGTGTIANDNGTDIVLEEVASTGAAADVSIADAGGIINATTVEGALQEIAAEIDGMDAIVDADTTAAATGYVVPTLETPSADFKVLNSVTETDGKLTAATAYNIKKVAATGAAADVSYDNTSSGLTADDVQEAIDELKTSITNSNLTIDGQVGAITTGNGITGLTSNSKVIALDLDTTNSNGMYLSGSTEGSKQLAMHIADESTTSGANFGTVKVTNGNGLTITSGVVAYAHNTSAITVASQSGNAITINGTLTPDASDTITTSGSITLADVAATGSASDVTVTSATYGGSTATTDLQQALTNLAAATAVVDNVGGTAETITVNDTNATTIATVGGNTISTKVAFYWEEYA